MNEFTRFLAVADLGNVSRAAETLNLSQPALSRTISLLERRFRTTLFVRRGGRMELTGAGRILYDHASRALRLLHGAEERIDYEGIGGSLSLSICAGDSWGNAILPGIVAGFTAAHPEIDLRLDIVGSEERMAGLSAGNYELSYGILLPRHEVTGKLRFRPMMQAPYIVYASEQHPLRRLGRLPSNEELLSCEWLKHKFEYDHDPAKWQSIGRRYALSANTMLSSLELIRQTDLLMSTSEVNANLFARHKVTALCPDPDTYRHISGLHTLAGVELGQAARMFATWCEKRFLETAPTDLTGPLREARAAKNVSARF